MPKIVSNYRLIEVKHSISNEIKRNIATFYHCVKCWMLFVMGLLISLSAHFLALCVCVHMKKKPLSLLASWQRSNSVVVTFCVFLPFGLHQTGRHICSCSMVCVYELGRTFSSFHSEKYYLQSFECKRRTNGVDNIFLCWENQEIPMLWYLTMKNLHFCHFNADKCVI